MDNMPPPKPKLLDGLTKMLHLHQLPTSTTPSSPGKGYVPIPSPAQRMEKEMPPVFPRPSSRTFANAPPATPARVSANVSPAPRKTTVSPRNALPSPMEKSPLHSPSVNPGIIVTTYDRILDLVKSRGSIKLDEIARLLGLKEESVAQELQTLEDNGLVEVKYPAFGEPLIFYKTPGEGDA